MHTTKIDDTTYSVELYDWDDRHHAYLAGHIKRNPYSDGDAGWWRFYPGVKLAPFSAGDLRDLSTFIQELNGELEKDG